MAEPGRFEDRVQELSVEERISLLDGADFWRTTAVNRIGLPPVMLSDGPHGLRKQPEGGDHAGLIDSVPATCFPPAAGLASSWDIELVGRVAAAIADEARAADVAVLLGPGVNMKRSPLCGRNFEYFSEDPLLAGTLASAFVTAAQSRGVGTSLKHYAVNNQETNRMTVSADVDERTIREIYLPAFERVVTESQPWTVMCSYNRLNGTYVSENPWLLTDVLRTEWGFTGLVVSDWGAVNDRAAALRAGLDLEMPSSSGSGTDRLRAALVEGSISQGDIDRSARQVLRLVDRAAAMGVRQQVDLDAHHGLARDAARVSAVLLKNDGDLLPLDPAQGGTIAIIGEFARTPRYQGAGSSQVNPTRLDTALDSIRAIVAKRRPCTFSAGYTTDDRPNQQLLDEAVTAAESAEVVVLFLGLDPAAESEGWDRTHIDLPASQRRLVEAVRRVAKQVVVVLSNGSVVAVDPWQQHVDALLEGWLLGQAGGGATAELLFGITAPSGRLAETIPQRLEDNPALGMFPGEHGHVRYGEGLLIGYRWYDTHRLPVAYPFGHGLTYTRFAYSNLGISVEEDGSSTRAQVTFQLRNVGSRAGVETAQVYVQHLDAPVHRPDQELRGFARVALDAGQSQQVTVELPARAFAYWNTVLQRWHIAPGTYRIRIGASSRDLRLEQDLALNGEPIRLPLTAQDDAEAWLDHPASSAWLTDIFTGQDLGGLLLDPGEGRMLRAIPMTRLARLPGTGLDERTVASAVDRFFPATGPDDGREDGSR